MKYKFFTASLVIWCAFSMPLVSLAATAESVNQQISSINAQIQALDKEIKQYQDQINLTTGQANTLANLIKELTLTRNKLLKEVDQTQKKITNTGLVIGTINNDIEAQQRLIDTSKLSISKMLQVLHERDNSNVLMQLFSKTSLIDASREYNNIISFNKNIRNHIVDLKQQVDNLTISKNQKESEQQNLNKLKKSLVDKKLAVDAAKKEKDTLLFETKNQESAYKKLLAESQKKRDAFEKDLENYEAQLKFILNPNLLPGEGSGILSWPLDNIFITQLFGKTVSAKRLYVSGSHSGVDFRASIGTPVKSMGSGVVVGTGDTDLYCKGASFGKWVFIKYNNGLSSTFGHLSVISSSAGQSVNTGDVVGFSGNTGHSTGPHLHVAVYASQGADVKTVPSLSCNGKTFTMPIAPVSAYLDPMLYLPKLSGSMIKNDTRRD
jgi:murein DD-endopeptidase MepM/ murein hydrolase activator NlpD